MKHMLQVFLAALALLPCLAFAQAYPNKPVRLILPFPPGGTSDYLGRLLADKFLERWGQQMVIDYRTGASGNLAAEYVARAPADGYTLLLMPTDLAINQGLFRKLNYHPLRDLAPISSVVYTVPMVAAHPGSGITSLQDLIAKAKAQPGKLSYASCGNGTPQHLLGEQLKLRAGIDMVHVPYKGCGPAAIEAVGGQVPIVISAAANLIPQFSAGRLTPLAVSTATRNAALPAVPTIAESGFPDFEVTNWFGLLAPAGTPREIVAKVAADLKTFYDDPAFVKKLTDRGLEPMPSTPEQFRSLIERDIEQFSALIKRIGAQVD